MRSSRPSGTLLPLPESRSGLCGMLGARRPCERNASTQIRIWVLDGRSIAGGARRGGAAENSGLGADGLGIRSVRNWPGIRRARITGRLWMVWPMSPIADALLVEDANEDLGPKPRGPLSPPHQDKKAGRGSLPTPTCDFPGAPGPIRTADTRFRRAVLYPLSYEGMERYSSTECRSVPTSSCRPSWPSPWRAPAREGRGASCRRGRGRDSRSACGTGDAWPSRR